MASDTSNFINIPIAPGGMLGDIVEDELGEHQHQRVENLRQVKKGEWGLVPGYRNTLTGLTAAKNAIEVDEDVSGDRFRLTQDGVNILRVDYNITNSPLFGYENEPTVALGLPSGVTIASTATLRFFHFRGVIRISGASEPLHYSYVDRTVFPGDDTFKITTWVLERAALQWTDNDVEVLAAIPIPSEEIDPINPERASLALFMKFFWEFDDGQYQLLRIPDTTAVATQGVFGFTEEIFPSQLGSNIASIELRIPGNVLKGALFNKRITGLGLAFATVPYTFGSIEGEKTGAYKGDLEPYFVPEILRISANPDDITKIKEIGFGLTAANWVSSTPTILEISDPNDSFPGVIDYGKLFLPPEAGYLGPGVKIKISQGDNPNVSIDTTVVTIIQGGNSPAVLTVTDDMSAVFGSTGTKPNVGFNITVEWQYDAANGYKTYYGLNLLVLGTLYSKFAGIPTGTLRNTPNWEAIQFIGELSYISGQTGDIGSTVVSGGTIETVAVIEDTFTDADGVLLTAHTMDKGSGWIVGTAGTTVYEIQSNECHDSGAGFEPVLFTEANRSDKIKITGKFFITSPADTIDIRFRRIDNNDEWVFRFHASINSRIDLIRKIAIVNTVRDTQVHTIADGQFVTFEIELDGDVITAKILTPESHTLQTTDSTHNTATKVGFSMTQILLSRLDDFKVTEDILVPASTAVANDNFTDTNGVALTAHTMNLGNGWTSAGAQWEIQSNEARDSGAGSGVQVITELNKSDKLIITGKIMINNSLDETRISFRHFTINDEWLFSYSGSNTPTFEIRRVIAGVTTVQATQAHTVADGTFVSFQITLDGSSIELKILSPEIYTLTVTDSTHLIETKLAFFPLATNAGVTRIDDLVVVEIVGSFLIESQEEDTVRHSAINQIDNHPIGNVIQTEVGTTDKILNLAKRDNQLTILKARSISTGGFVGAFYTENIGFTKHGLYSVLGVFSVTITINAEESNEFIFIMDQDDLYLYNGNQIVSFFEKIELRKFYRDNVTTSSFMLFDKLSGEMMFFLGTEILVWNMHVPEFYIRKTDITPLYGFLDADNRLIIGNATKQVTFNHGLGTPYDESLSILIRTKVNDLRTPHRFKKLEKLHSYLSSSEDVTIRLSDVQGAVPGVAMQSTRGVVDHWIAQCTYIFAPNCYAPDLEAWQSTQVGRTDFESTSSGAFVIKMLQAELNNRDVVEIPDSPTNFGSIGSSANNAAYAYMHAGQGWFALAWKQVETSLPNEPATLWGNDSYGEEIAGFQFHTQTDSNSNTLFFSLTRAASVRYISFDSLVSVKMGDWNYFIVSWEQTTGRNGLRMNINRTIVDRDNTIFNGTPTTNLSIRDILWARRAIPRTPIRPANIQIVEMGAGSVGLTNSEISDMADYIEDQYAFLGLIPIQNKTISSPTTLKPRIEHDCKYLFKELQIDFSNATNSNSLTAQIRDYLLKVERWQKP